MKCKIFKSSIRIRIVLKTTLDFMMVRFQKIFDVVLISTLNRGFACRPTICTSNMKIIGRKIEDRRSAAQLRNNLLLQKNNSNHSLLLFSCCNFPTCDSSIVYSDFSWTWCTSSASCPWLTACWWWAAVQPQRWKYFSEHSMPASQLYSSICTLS